MGLAWTIAGWQDAVTGALAFMFRPALPRHYLLALAALALLLFPFGGGTFTALRTPVLYHRIELPRQEPMLLELALPPGDYQIAPASLGYFTEDESGGARRFIYTAEVPRGLVYTFLPPAKTGAGSAPDPGRAVVLEIAAPGSDGAYFDQQLDAIRANVVELNRQRNLLLQAQSGAVQRSPYSKTVAALWANLSFSERGVRDAGWAGQVLRKYPRDLERIVVAVGQDGQARAEQKRLWYSVEQARLKLLLSQYDLQLGLARLPRRRREELLSLGKEQLVKAVLLAQLDHQDRAWQQRAADLQRAMEIARAELQHLPAAITAAPPTPAAPAGGLGTLLSTTIVRPLEPAASGSPHDRLEWAVLTAWLAVQQAELDSLQAARPALEQARAHAGNSATADWSTLPKVTVAAGAMRAPELEELRYYGALDSGADPAATVNILAGLARQFETTPDRGNPVHSNVFGAQQREEVARTGLASGEVDASPDEVAYGLLALERCRPGMAGTAGGDGSGSAVDAALGAGATPSAGAAVKAGTLQANDDPQVPLRAAVAGQLDVILHNPDSRGLAAYDLAYLKFMRWYAALGLSGESAAQAATDTSGLKSQSYGLSKPAAAP